MENYFIYKLTSPSGKIYIGRTQNFETRMIEHKYESTREMKRPLYKAIRKYGWDNFTREIVFETDDLDHSILKELEYIARHKAAIKKFGYNCTIETETGGDVWKGRKNTPEYKEFVEKMSVRNSGEGNAMYGKTHSAEAKKLQKEKAKGRFSLPWFIEKYGEEEGTSKYNARCAFLASRKVVRDKNNQNFAKFI